MFLILFLVFLAALHLPFFRRKALWNTFGERVAWSLALPLAVMGGLHLLLPDEFESLIPAWLPSWMPEDHTLIIGGGIALVVVSLGLVVRKVRRIASFGVIGLLASFLPANFTMAQQGYELSNGDPVIPPDHWLGWANLVLQAVPMGIAWFVGRK